MKPVKTYDLEHGTPIHDGYFIMINGALYWTSINKVNRTLKVA